MPWRNSGFTLIELVIVIVILGIIAAFALPRFVDLRSNSNVAVLEAMGGAMRSAANIVHSKALVKGVQDEKETTVEIDGTEVSIWYGYPSAYKDKGISQVVMGGSENDWAWSNKLAPRRFFLTTAKLAKVSGRQINNLPVTDTGCYLRYDRASATGDPPKISYVTTDC